MSNFFSVDVTRTVFTSTSVVSSSDLFWVAGYSDANIVIGTSVTGQDSAHNENTKKNYVSYRINNIHVRGEASVGGSDGDYNMFYVVLYKAISKSNGLPNISYITPVSTIKDFFLYKQPEVVLCYKVYRVGDEDNREVESVRFDINLNKIVFVRPDEIVGIHYCLFSDNNDGFNSPLRRVEATADVRFDLV